MARTMNLPESLSSQEYIDELSPEQLGYLILMAIEDSDGSLGYIQHLLDNGGSLDIGGSPDDMGHHRLPALHYAACLNRPKIVKLLLNAGSDVNSRDHSGSTPLHWAALQHRVEIIEILLAHGADKTAKEDRANFTPWDVAQSRTRKECPELEP